MSLNDLDIHIVIDSDRRLRDGLLVAVLTEELPAEHTEDRPFAHGQAR